MYTPNIKIKEEFYNDFKNILFQLNPNKILLYWDYIPLDNCFISPILIFKSNKYFTIKAQIYYYPERLEYFCHFYFYLTLPHNYYENETIQKIWTFTRAITVSSYFQRQEMKEAIARETAHQIYESLINTVNNFLNEYYENTNMLNLYPKENI